MRAWVLAAGIGLLAPTVAAFGQAGTPAQPAVKPRPSAGQPATAGTPAAANEEARRQEAARHKRWDDRMRRATKSLCDRC